MKKVIWVYRMKGEKRVPTIQLGPSGPLPVLTDLKIAGSSSTL